MIYPFDMLNPEPVPGNGNVCRRAKKKMWCKSATSYNHNHRASLRLGTTNDLYQDDNKCSSASLEYQ